MQTLHRLVAVILFSSPLLSPVNAQEPFSAIDIETFSGIQGGLCVIFENSEGRSTDALARTGRFLVHTLAVETSAVGPMRARMAEAGLAPFVTVESWTPPGLPFLQALHMDDQRVDRFPEQIQLVHRQLFQLLQVVLDRVDDLLVRPLHRSHEVGRDGRDDRAEEHGRAAYDPHPADDLART